VNDPAIGGEIAFVDGIENELQAIGLGLRRLADRGGCDGGLGLWVSEVGVPSVAVEVREWSETVWILGSNEADGNGSGEIDQGNEAGDEDGE